MFLSCCVESSSNGMNPTNSFMMAEASSAETPSSGACIFTKPVTASSKFFKISVRASFHQIIFFALYINNFTLLVHHIIKLDETFALIKEKSFDFTCACSTALLIMPCSMGCDSSIFKNSMSLLICSPPNKRIISSSSERKNRRSWITLATRATTELIINTTRLMALSSQHVKSAQHNNSFMIFLPSSNCFSCCFSVEESLCSGLLHQAQYQHHDQRCLWQQ